MPPAVISSPPPPVEPSASQSLPLPAVDPSASQSLPLPAQSGALDAAPGRSRAGLVFFVLLLALGAGGGFFVWRSGGWEPAKAKVWAYLHPQPHGQLAGNAAPKASAAASPAEVDDNSATVAAGDVMDLTSGAGPTAKRHAHLGAAGHRGGYEPHVATRAPTGAVGGGGDLGEEIRNASGGGIGVGKDAVPTTTAVASGSTQAHPSLGQVQAALMPVLPSARACFAPDSPETRAMITFESSGAVKSVSVTGYAKGRPEESCVRGMLAKARVDPFSDATYSVPVHDSPLRSRSLFSGVAAGVEELGAVLEVHRVEVVPAAAPHEAFGLERVDDGLRVTVLPREWAVLRLATPVVRALRVEIDRDRPRVHAELIAPGDAAPVERAAGRLEEPRERRIRLHRARDPLGDAAERLGDLAMHRERLASHAHGHERVLHVRRGLAVRGEEERVDADATGVEVDHGDGANRARRVHELVDVAHVGRLEPLVERLRATVVVRDCRAVGQDERPPRAVASRRSGVVPRDARERRGRARWGLRARARRRSRSRRLARAPARRERDHRQSQDVGTQLAP